MFEWKQFSRILAFHHYVIYFLSIHGEIAILDSPLMHGICMFYCSRIVHIDGIFIFNIMIMIFIFLEF